MATVSGNYTSATQYRVMASGLTYGARYRLFVEDLGSDNQGNGWWYCHYADDLYDTQIDYRTRQISYTGQRGIRLYEGTYSSYDRNNLYFWTDLPPAEYMVAQGEILPLDATTYKVFFVTNSGGDTVNHMPDTINFVSGTSVLIPYDTPTRSGYTFLGWSQFATYTEPQYTAGQVVKFSNNTNLYAVWKEVTSKTYYGRLNLNANGGTINNSAYVYYPYPAQGNASTDGGATVSIQIPSLESYIPKQDGFRFACWKDTSTGYIYNIGDWVDVWSQSTYQSSPAEVVLYAVWEKLPDITMFFWDGADGIADSYLIATGQPVSNITATRWNNLLAKIKELADAVGADFSYTRVNSGAGITADCFNEAQTGLYNIKTALGASNVSLPAKQSKGNTMYATLFNGGTSLKGALNALIGVYNNG